LHGVGDIHDRVVNRIGAYRETLLAAERARSVGLDAGCNVFLTRENIAQFDAMVEALRKAGVDQFIVEPAWYYPTGRGRRHEAVRPELQDLLPLAEKVRTLSPFARDVWADLAAYTEAAYVRRALAGEWVEQLRHSGDVVDLVCRRNLDVFSGAAGLYRQRHGNLRADGAKKVFHQALEYGPRPYDALWFWLEPFLSLQELAEQFGNADGQQVHFTPASMRYRWLDLAQQAMLKR
jgi:MoaA/NifB/PqqE/SkfB family radical SAM enzyme